MGIVLIVIIYLLILVSLFLAGIYRLVKLFKRRKEVSYSIQYKLFTLIFLVVPIYLIGSFYYFLTNTWQNHYDVTRGTLRWVTAMTDHTITDFPIIEPKTIPVYNYISSDGPGIGTAWEVQYSSTKDLEIIQTELTEFSKKEGYELVGVTEPACSWKNYAASRDTILLSGQKTDRCLDITIIREKSETRVEAIVCE